MLTFKPNPIHEYYWNGVRVPSVTEILDDVGIVDYSSIPFGVREMALQRGSDVHTATHYDDENDLEFDEELWLANEIGYEREYQRTGRGVAPTRAGYVAAWRKFRRETGFTPDLIEHKGYNEAYRFAGTLDRMGTYLAPSVYSPVNEVRTIQASQPDILIDIKCGDAPQWTRLQLAAYASFFQSPRRFTRVAVELHKDNTYRLFRWEGKDWQADFNAFVACLMVYNMKREFNAETYKQRHRKGNL
jgi:hypothetical protein